MEFHATDAYSNFGFTTVMHRTLRLSISSGEKDVK
jgi:hypothetical protein